MKKLLNFIWERMDYVTIAVQCFCVSILTTIILDTLAGFIMPFEVCIIIPTITTFASLKFYHYLKNL